MTEEDTFKALKKAPYNELLPLWKEYYAKIPKPDSWSWFDRYSVFLQIHGWTDQEWESAWRNKCAEDLAALAASIIAV